MDQASTSSWRNQVQPIPGFLQPGGPAAPQTPASTDHAARIAAVRAARAPRPAPPLPPVTEPPRGPARPHVPTAPPLPAPPGPPHLAAHSPVTIPPAPTVSFHKTSFMFLMLGMIVLVLLSFVVGFLIGARTFLPSGPDRAAATEPAKSPHREIPGEKTLAHWGVTESAVLQQVEGALPATAGAALQTLTSPSTDKPTHPAPHALPGARSAPLAMTSPPVHRGVVYTLQVGSFHAADPALKTADAYRQQGYPAYVVKSWGSEGRLWYYVRIGQFGAQKEANDQAMKMIQHHHVSAMVVEQKSSDVKL
jgi:cell division septation protein DedD